jgi:arginine decarboxylase
LYNVSNWGAGFFTISDRGHVEVRPRGEDGPRIDCLELVQDLHQRGLRTPLLIRFSDILASRVRGLCGAFARAIEEYGYHGAHRGVYPIKVNQQRHVVEEIVEYGAEMRVGLEAGSKPELLIALAVLDTPGALIVCNGSTSTWRRHCGAAVGRTPIIGQFREIDLIGRTARDSIRPHIGGTGRS